jgi:outer membrane protein assembly factor BamB
MKKHVKLLIGLCLLDVWFLLLMSSTGCSSMSLNANPLPTPSGSHQVASSSLPLAEIWRYRAGYAEALDLQFNPSPLIIARNKIIISTYVDANDRSHSDSLLTARDLNSGNTLWQTRYGGVDRYDGTRINSFYFDEKLNRLYLQYAFNLGAFDTETGKQLWFTPKLGDHTTYVFAHEQQDGVLTVRTNNNELLTFNPNDGQLLSKEKVDYFLTMTHNGTEIPIPHIAEFKWKFDCYRPGLWPTFVGAEDILLECSRPFMIYRANYKTGQTIWRTSHSFVSNYAIRGNTLYILDRFAQLNAIDLETGGVVGMMIFDEGIMDPNNIRPFWIVIQDPYLIIYFGDTQELVAFKFEAK